MDSTSSVTASAAAAAAAALPLAAPPYGPRDPTQVALDRLVRRQVADMMARRIVARVRSSPPPPLGTGEGCGLLEQTMDTELRDSDQQMLIMCLAVFF